MSAVDVELVMWSTFKKFGKLSNIEWHNSTIFVYKGFTKSTFNMLSDWGKLYFGTKETFGKDNELSKEVLTLEKLLRNLRIGPTVWHRVDLVV